MRVSSGPVGNYDTHGQSYKNIRTEADQFILNILAGDNEGEGGSSRKLTRCELSECTIRRL